MSALNTDKTSTQISNTPSTTPLSPIDHLQYVQKVSGAESMSPVYEGFTFFKAMPKQSATWTCVKRTGMNLSQDEYFKMIQKRANKKSAVQQYQSLSSDTRRAHINQLMDEQRHNNPLVEWSCVYAKENRRISKARHARRGDYETVSMDVIVMKRPMKTQAYFQASMGGLVTNGEPFRSDTKDSPVWSHYGGHPLTSGRNGNILRPMLQNLPSQVALAMNPFAPLNSARRPDYVYLNGRVGATSPDVETSGSGNQLHEPALSTATINNRPASPAFSATNSSDMSLERTSDCSSESNSDPDDASMLSDQSDESSATNDPESMETETEIELLTAASRVMGLILAKSPKAVAVTGRMPPREQSEAPPVKILGSRQAERARSGSFSGKRYRKQPMNDHDIRSRMLDHREASLGHREKWLKRTFSEARQLERRQPARDPPSVCRCACRCAIKEKREAA
ncbi:hypothetical protein N7519_005553 [Penicillium mononematosum]|uniref:uncharacterized protein n=1 Tax=Penicillium mononematosum TaxID=268346 RepID=UPI00254757D3|nr:uncharacterized protein N7519_005553 [Penicillium mononematosum]KAJ6184252.1 hypothetical protein N7519_005553 [Penicillium mononematosum]